ncbi:cyclic nucleotide-binding domain-containing protein [Myxococcota bacterium]|nr:cyclic nucleotide-binding domain-containing protein [Myxococcota bacterium]
MNRTDFFSNLRALLSSSVEGITEQEKLRIIEHFLSSLQKDATSKLPLLRIIPFVRGRRPFDEIRYAGYGSSEHVGLLVPLEEAANNTLYLLYQIQDPQERLKAHPNDYTLRLSVGFCDPLHPQKVYPLPYQTQVPVHAARFAPQEHGEFTLTRISPEAWSPQSLVLALHPNNTFLPDAAVLSNNTTLPNDTTLPNELAVPDGKTPSLTPWSWDELAPTVTQYATDHDDPFTFGHLFHQRARISLTLHQQDLPISEASFDTDIFDARRFGSLYQRVLEKIIQPDTVRQAQESGISAIDHTYHPWYPVLSIGTEKADLYMKALYQDIVQKKRHLTEPKWLLRVGLYLEFLTCLGIFEAVKDELGDMLSPTERCVFEQSPHFEKIRKAIHPKAWKEVWNLRKISFAKNAAPDELPVKITHLLAKKKATLGFLKAHHEDLKWAIEMAGPNPHNAQETWHRVFRDAERAVLRKSLDAFPELNGLSAKVREFVMWHQKGKLDLVLLKSIPSSISGLFGDQDGLYASACNQYRDSMNEVAQWAKERGLMDYAGNECVPSEISLLRAHMNQQSGLVSLLQRRDGYAPELEALRPLPEEYRESHEQIAESLHHLGLFEALSHEERETLASKARLIELGPMERITIQGQPGSSLFILSEGVLEVLVRQKDGHDAHIASLPKGAVFGEISFLTGAKRSSTVRALEKALVIEIHSDHLRPIVQNRPQILEAFTSLMEKRLEELEDHSQAYDEHQKGRSLLGGLKNKLRTYLLGA